MAVQYTFGTGLMFGTRTDVINSTPIPFGAMQDVVIDFDPAKKYLYAQSAFPVAAAMGKSKMVCKAKFAQITGRLLNDLLFAQPTVVGRYELINGEAGAIAAGAYTSANSATWADDLGVWFTVGGALTTPLTKVASAPAVGQYTVAAGVYGFNAGDNAKTISVFYMYNPAGGALPQQKISMPNPQLGTSPSFQVYLANSFYAGQNFSIKLRKCISEKLTLNLKMDDFVIPEFDFDVIDDGTGVMFDYATSN